MKKFIVILLAVTVLVIVGGGIVLASITVAPPATRIEKPLADEKMAK